MTPAVDWTQVLVALITTAGAVLSGIFAARAGRHSKRAAVSAQEAVAASSRPPPPEPHDLRGSDG